jgi:hypothetical protein
MDIRLQHVLLGVLVLTIGMYVLKVSYESFRNPPLNSVKPDAVIANAAQQAPDIKAGNIKDVITGIRAAIDKRPDIIAAVKQVIADPKINATLWNVLSTIKRPAK